MCVCHKGWHTFLFCKYPLFLFKLSRKITSVRRIHGKRISDAELTIITNLTNLFPIKNDNYWLKIGKIGNYCQLKTACCLPYRNYSLKLIKLCKSSNSRSLSLRAKHHHLLIPSYTPSTERKKIPAALTGYGDSIVTIIF